MSCPWIWAKIMRRENMRRENISAPIYVQCDNMYKKEASCQEFCDTWFGLEIWLSNPKMKRMHVKHLFKVARYSSGWLSSVHGTDPNEIKCSLRAGCRSVQDQVDLGEMPGLMPPCPVPSLTSMRRSGRAWRRFFPWISSYVEIDFESMEFEDLEQASARQEPRCRLYWIL